MIGQTLSHYKILEKLGSGGMGDVYVAEDTKLNRKVALKVLPPEMASAQRRKRFEREAKAVAALNHPNIVTVHSVEEAEGVHFITMEWVRGKTLSELIPRKGLALNKFFEIAIPLADAVTAAHQEGITHRDLKPLNIMVSREGRLKVLDFGLSKLKQEVKSSALNELPTQSATQEGRIVGTAAYMSPEQAEGKSVDPRSDIFSLGITLYEMATGQLPFAGDTTASILSSILKDTPASVTELNPAVPSDLSRIIRRCLVKDPERRYQTAKDLRNELEELKQEVESGDSVSAERVLAPEARRTWRWVLAGVVALGMGAGGWLYVSSLELDRPPPRTIPLTAYPGSEGEPAISPDGSQVAFTMVGDPGGARDLYLKLIEGGEPLLISHGSGAARTPTWSPDGRQIAFIRHLEPETTIASKLGGPVPRLVLESGARGIFIVSALGGAERQIATARPGYGYGLSWSPDGKLLAIVDRESTEDPDSIFLLSLETGDNQRLTRPPFGHTGDQLPRFSPDGRTVAFQRRGRIAQSDIYLVSVDGGEPRRLTHENRFTPGLDWTPDGRSIVFSATRPGRAGFVSLWRVSTSGGEPEPLEVGEQGRYPTFSRQGGRLSYAKLDRKWDIWRVGGPSAREQDKSPVRLISSTAYDYFPHYSPDGQNISFTSTRSGFHEIWICDSDGSNPRQLTFLEDAQTFDGSWSPDGQQIAFFSFKEGSADIYVVNVAGGFARRLTTESSHEVAPRWSSDGHLVYFASNRTGRNELYKMPVKGGEAIQLTTNGGTVAFESRDGQSVYFAKSHPDGGPHGIWNIPIDGGEEVQILEHAEFILWELLEQRIYYLNRDVVPTAVELLDVTTAEVSQVTLVEERPSLYGFSVSPDGRWFVYTLLETESDIMLVENFR